MTLKELTVLGFDYGTKKIGVAVGQSITGNAQALAPLKARDGIPNWDQIQQLIETWQPHCLIIGNPLNMDGSEQDITQRAKKFANRLNGRFKLPVHLIDERLSTVEARQRLFDQGGYKALKQQSVDSLAAAIMIEDWLRQKA